MKSSDGAHYIALDHVRALAAFIVVSWHFTHAAYGFPVPFSYTPTFIPIAILDEGHTGVALFMTLSGYLFAKLLNGKSIVFSAFLWNRALRLLPLLLCVIVIAGIIKYINNRSITEYLQNIALGLIVPSLPNGGWSITVEFHFYIILPLLLWMQTRYKLGLPAVILTAIALRAILFMKHGEVQTLAHWTIVGRIDQFILGMMAYQLRDIIKNRSTIAIAIIAGFMLFWWNFDRIGGLYHYPSYPSPKPLWIFLTTIEGIAYGVAIAWYDNSFKPPTHGLSRLIGLIGEYSFSIYLLHFFFVFGAARFVHKHIMDISNFNIAICWSIVFFFFMIIPAKISHMVIESPFLGLRKKYIRNRPPNQINRAQE